MESLIVECALTELKDSKSNQWTRNGPPILLVNPDSSKGGRSWEIGDEYIISIDGNHFDMVKFVESGSDGYGKVLDVLREFIDLATGIIFSRLQNYSGMTLHLF